jgi:hypothetical protein
MDDEVFVFFFSLIIPGDPELLFELEGKPSHGENKESFF